MVFVPFVLPGEEVEVDLIEVKKQYARARLLRVLRPAPQGSRPDTSARAADASTSTSIMEQVRIKHRHVADLLERIGKKAGGPG